MPDGFRTRKPFSPEPRRITGGRRLQRRLLTGVVLPALKQGILHMGIIATIIIGLIVGLVARFLKPGDDSMGWIMTIILGIVGSVVATYLGQALGIYRAGEGAGFIGAVVGAIIVLFIYGMVTKRR